MGVCPQCEGERLVKNGSAAGKPKKWCKQCGCQLPCTTPRGKPLAATINAVLWYLRGMSMYRMGFLLRVSTQAVLTWVRALATAYDETPEPTGRPIILQRDAMWHYLKNKRGKLWMWKAPDGDTGQLLDWECGRRDKRTLKKMVDRLAPWDVTMYGTDKEATYASVILQDNLMQSKQRHMILNGITVGNATGLGASSASPSLSRIPKRWSISPWHSSQILGQWEPG